MSLLGEEMKLCWAGELCLADRCAAEELFCSRGVLVCRETPRDDGSQLSGIDDRNNGAHIWAWVHLHKSCEGGTHPAPSEVWVCSGRGAGAGNSQGSVGTGLLQEVGTG